jgi:hypothetical protein
MPYLDVVERCFQSRPEWHDDAVIERAAADLARVLPGEGDLVARVEAWDARFEVPVDRVPAVAGWLVERFRARAETLFGLPAGEALRVSIVRDQPWSGYNWYDGGLRSRVDLNTDLPIRAADIVHTIAHETYPGHHLEHAWKEADLVREGRLESSVLLINAPECLVSEGLADLGHRFASPPETEPDLFVELYERAGLAIATDPLSAREAAELQVRISAARRGLLGARCNASILRHVRGASREEAVGYLVSVGWMPRAIAEKRMDFAEHPLWRTYTFVYHDGEALLKTWLEAVPEAERPARFGRLLHEQLTPAAIRAELGAADRRPG